MELFTFNSQAELDNFIKKAADQRGAEFLQSWQWGEILRFGGEEIRRLGIKNEAGEIMAALTIVKKSLGAGVFYWYAPRGPIIGFENNKKENDSLTHKALTVVFNFFAESFKKNNPRALFWRLEPNILKIEAKDNFKLDGRALKKTLNLQPERTLILELDKKEEELLASMHQKTRYNIRLAEKKEIEIKRGSIEDLGEFKRLMELTGARDGFRVHSATHYERLLKQGAGFIELYFAQYQNRKIATGLFCFFGDKVTYMHGASDNEFRNLMAPYFLQWFLIKEAKRRGYQYYDFYGIDEKKWPGVTRFKLGYGGRETEYVGTYDLVFHPRAYLIYNFLRKLRRLA